MAPSREAHLAAVLGYPGSGLSSGSGGAPRAGAQGRDADRGTYRGRGPGKVATTVLALLLLVLAAACAGYVLGSRQASSSSDGVTASPVPGGPGGATAASASPVTGGRP